MAAGFFKDSCYAVSGQPLQKSPWNHPVFAFLAAARIADPIASLHPHRFAGDMLPTRQMFARLCALLQFAVGRILKGGKFVSGHKSLRDHRIRIFAPDGIIVRWDVN
jgi:hypothetical protein